MCNPLQSRFSPPGHLPRANSCAFRARPFHSIAYLLFKWAYSTWLSSCRSDSPVLLACPDRPVSLECPPTARTDLFYVIVHLLPGWPVSLDCLPVARMSCFTRLPTCCPNRSVLPGCLPVSQIGLFYTIARLFSGRPPRSLPACPHFG